MGALELVVVLAVFLVIVFFLWLVVKISSSAGTVSNLQTQLEALRDSQYKLSETLQGSLNSGQETVNKNLVFHSKALADISKQLGDLQQSNKQMTQLGSDVRRLHTILASPKLRGGFGEWSLESLLKKVLPLDCFVLQSAFKDGKTVDALIKMPDYSVPVDAKFPLNNFENMQKAENEPQAQKFRREFLKDVKKHIDKIADSYIKPAEGTLDFALMFIPAENIYYETIIKTSEENNGIQDYAMDRKVIPVSPNLLYVYLMTVVMGLHGLQIETAAAEIRKNLKGLNSSLLEFISNWDTLGSHIRNAHSKYDDSQKKLDKFAMQLEIIQQEKDQQT